MLCAIIRWVGPASNPARLTNEADRFLNRKPHVGHGSTSMVAEIARKRFANRSGEMLLNEHGRQPTAPDRSYWTWIGRFLIEHHAAMPRPFDHFSKSFAPMPT